MSISTLKEHDDIISENTTAVIQRRSTRGSLSSDLGKMNLLGQNLGSRARDVTKRLSVSSYLQTGRFSQSLPFMVEPEFENTYKMEENGEEFHHTEIEKMLIGILKSTVWGRTYNPEECSRLSAHVSTIIKNEMKNLNMPRYKLVCNVLVGQKQKQGISFASRCLWDAKTDRHTSATYENDSIFVTATVYGIYFE